MKHLAAVPVSGNQPPSEAQLSFAKDLGINPAGHTAATMSPAIKAAVADRDNAVKNPPISRQSASPFDTSSVEHHRWTEIGSFFKIHQGRGRVEWQVALTLQVCDPFGEWEHCYPSEVKEAIIRLEGAGFDLHGAVNALQEAEDQRSGFAEYVKCQAIASVRDEGGVLAA